MAVTLRLWRSGSFVENIYVDRKVTSRVHHESENSHSLAYRRGPLSSTSKQCRKFPDYPTSIAIVED